MSPPDHGAAAAARVGPPAWTLLDTTTVLADRQNATTASARTSTGEAIQVTFFAADPPHDSYFSVHCPALEKDTTFPMLGLGPVAPMILYSEGDLALLAVAMPRLASGHAMDYYIYRAGRRPSLQLLRGIDRDSHTRLYLGSVGVVVPRSGSADDADGERFVLATLGRSRLEQGKYDLHVFRSDRGAWTNHALVLGSPVFLQVEKAVALGGGELGWVDPRRGILACDVLDDEDPKPHVIPLPWLLPANQRTEPGQRFPQLYRDVVVLADGSLRCVEMEHCVRRVVQEVDVSGADVLHDSDLALGLASADVRPPDRLEYLGWRVITWNKAVSSDCWRKGALLHGDDILANDYHGHAPLLGETIGEGRQALTVRNLVMDVPSLSVDGGDVVYIMAKASNKTTDAKMWVVVLAAG